MRQLIALLAGTIFGAGLTISGMTNTNKVIGFLDVTGNWDASLFFVMAVALMVVIPAFYFIQRWQKPVLGNEFCLPDNNTLINKKLIVGSSLFGIGWGLYGYCPGPAISSLTYLNMDSYIFVLMMLVGMFAASRIKFVGD